VSAFGSSMGTLMRSSTGAAILCCGVEGEVSYVLSYKIWPPCEANRANTPLPNSLMATEGGT